MQFISVKSFTLYYLLFVVLFAAPMVFFQKDLAYGAPLTDLLSLKLSPYIMGFYFFSCAVFLVHAIKPRIWLSQFASFLLFLGSAATGALLISTTYEAYKILEEGYVTITNLYEVSLLFLSSVSFLAMFYGIKNKTPSLIAWVTPLLSISACWTLYLDSLGQGGPQELVPALKSYWLTYHVIANFIGYGAFAVGAVLGIMMLVSKRQHAKQKPTTLPEVKKLEMLSYRVIAVGFPIFSVAIILGSLWAYEAWGGYWSWDPKETWALIVWLVYAAYLHARVHNKYSVVVMSWWLIIGFLVTVFCFLGVNLFLSGLHSYGTLK